MMQPPTKKPLDSLDVSGSSCFFGRATSVSFAALLIYLGVSRGISKAAVLKQIHMK